LKSLITALATTMAADVTGIVAASLMAVLGLFIIPASRRKAKRDLHERLANLRTNLVSASSTEFKKEMRLSVARIKEAIAPYSRFVRAETARADQVLGNLGEAKVTIEGLRSELLTLLT